MIEVETVRH